LTSSSIPSEPLPQSQEQETLSLGAIEASITEAQVRYENVGARILLVMLWPSPFSLAQLACILDMPRQTVAEVIGQMIADGVVRIKRGD
jgi:hypothetical protein